jgi:hypothetical protein
LEEQPAPSNKRQLLTPDKAASGVQIGKKNRTVDVENLSENMENLRISQKGPVPFDPFSSSYISRQLESLSTTMASLPHYHDLSHKKAPCTKEIETLRHGSGSVSFDIGTYNSLSNFHQKTLCYETIQKIKLEIFHMYTKCRHDLKCRQKEWPWSSLTASALVLSPKCTLLTTWRLGISPTE